MRFQLQGDHTQPLLSYLTDANLSYRNIRYSVSPRFELETAVSKLTWLSRWISPAELKEAVEDARNILVSGDNSGSRQLNRTEAVAYDRPAAGNANAGSSAGTAGSSAPAGNLPPLNTGGRSLKDEFKRMVAAKESPVPPSASTDEDRDVPLWNNTVSPASSKTESQVERVLSFIPGTVVEKD